MKFQFLIGLFSLLNPTLASPWASEILYEWTIFDFTWPSPEDRDQAIRNKSFIQDHNALAGIKVLDRRIFVTIPRWRLGVPSTLNEIRASNTSTSPLLSPFPDWSMQQIGECSAFQYVQSMEILPQTREMWVIDVGRINIFTEPKNLCPAKIVILDIDSGKTVLSFEFPDAVAPRDNNFLNDIVLDPVKRIAYISDTMAPGLVVFNAVKKTSHRITHSSMLATLKFFNINGVRFNTTTPIDGIAMSPDFSTLFYCPLASTHLFSIPTSILNNPQLSTDEFSEAYKIVGNKQYPSDGMVMSQESLYFGALSYNSVFRWKAAQDINRTQAKHYWNVSITTPPQLLRRDNLSMQWPDTFAIDTRGHLYFTSNRLDLFFSNSMDFNGGANFRILKVKIGEQGYLANFVNVSVKSVPNLILLSVVYVLVLCF